MSKLVSVIKNTFIVFIATAVGTANAEYYISYGAPTVVCVSCEKPRPKVHRYHRVKHYKKPCYRKPKPIYYRPRSYHSVSVTYTCAQFPGSCGAAWVSTRGCGSYGGYSGSACGDSTGCRGGSCQAYYGSDYDVYGPSPAAVTVYSTDRYGYVNDRATADDLGAEMQINDDT